MKRVVAGVLTAAVLVGLLIAAGLRARDTVADTPEKCLDQMFQAMKEGDVPVYLACFAGELRQQLEGTVRQQGVDKFSQYLRDTVAPVKGRAVFAAEYATPDRVRLKVDRVYETRMWEYQGYRLERQSGVWKICAVDPAELHDPPVPYGTPAYPTPAGASDGAAADQ